MTESTGSPHGSAVFVDDTGTKSRRATIVARGVGVAAAGYVLLMLATLARDPWVPDLNLPGLGTASPNVAQAPPDLGPAATITPIPVETTTTEATSDSPAPAETTSTSVDTTTTASTTPFPPTSGPPVSTPASTTSTTDHPGNGPPTSIPGNGNGPPTSRPNPN